MTTQNSVYEIMASEASKASEAAKNGDTRGAMKHVKNYLDTRDYARDTGLKTARMDATTSAVIRLATAVQGAARYAVIDGRADSVVLAINNALTGTRALFH